jgi:peptide/nickel transport system substrate-binding protein
MMKPLVQFTCALALSAALGSPAIAGKSDDTIRAAFRQAPQSLDAYYSPGREGFLLSFWIYDALIYRDSKTLEFKPLLATSWKQIDDLTLEFEIRDGVKFHNGNVLTADDVVFTLNFASDPANKVFNQTSVNWIAKVEKTGPKTVRIIAKQVAPVALEQLARLPIYSAAYYKSAGREGMGKNPVGTGPYKAEVGPNSTFIFTRFDDYFQGSVKGTPKIRRFIYETIPDVSTQIAELMTGSLDWAYYVPDDQAERLKRSPKLKVVNADTFRIAFLTMDAAGLTSSDTPLKNIKVRQAIAHAINREELAKNLMGGASRVIHSPCSPTQVGCSDDVQRYDYNVVKAKALMAEAGYPNGFEVEIFGYRSRPIADAIIGDLRAIGIKANLRWLQYPAVVQKRRENGTPMVIDDWGSSSINDVAASLAFFYGGKPDDQSRDAEVIAAVDKGDGSVDLATRKAAYLVALKKIAANAYSLPLFTMPINYVFSSEMEIPISPDEIPEFWRASWK